jgi:hypothetical protein
MPPPTVNCPSCGAPRILHNPGILLFVCEHCGSAVTWDEEKIRAAGQQAALPEGFTRLYRGAAGTLQQKRFLVLGRVRYSFGSGFWDEWFLELGDGSTRWLTEDNHELSLQREVSSPPLDRFEAYRPGSKILFDDREFRVQEVGWTECLGIEGELPRAIAAGERYAYVDASSVDGRFSLGIEYDEEVPTVFLGRWLRHAALRLDDEGDDW